MQGPMRRMTKSSSNMRRGVIMTLPMMGRLKHAQKLSKVNRAGFHVDLVL